MSARVRVVMVGAALIWLSQSGSAAEPISSPIPVEPYSWHNVVIEGGGFVTGIFFHPRQKGLIYARTDVGGAYRWDDAAHRWMPLTDWLGDVSLTGIESLAVDPSDPARVYLAAGIYSRDQAAILRSADEGRTWQRTDVPFKMGGNESGRFNGERLAVDPNDSAVLFFGSRGDGLWKSVDGAVTWQKVTAFPAVGTAIAVSGNFGGRFNFPPQAVGIVFVVFDPASGSNGKPTPVIYAGVADLATNLFYSADGGNTWQMVPGQPAGLRPNHAVLASDGELYLTYGKEPGPNTMTDGAVWKFNTESRVWTDITPLRPPDGGQPFGYGAIAVDPEHPASVVATTFCRWKPHDEIFRSTNGGASWMPLLQSGRWDYSNAPYTAGRVPHWMGSIQIDPFDSNHVLFSTGYGIWGCDNLTDADAGRPTHWSFSDAGLEETVPLALISPPDGAHLLSGLGDIDGFRHDDLKKSPRTGFSGPRFSNTEDLAFAGRHPEIIVRTGTSNHGQTRAAISVDDGQNWTCLASEPPGSAGAGGITISADGKTIVWTPRRGGANCSTDRGSNWLACAGIRRGVRVVADPENALRFYAFDPWDSRVLASTNGALNFTATEATLPPMEESSRNFGFSGVGTSLLVATPGREGDLWLTLQAGGLYHSSDGGESFVRLESVQAADSLGFGKASGEKEFPTQFLAGKIAGVRGLFRSDDSGITWTRINDDEHQYGAISHVTGDPRIPGRVYFATSGRGIIYGDPVPDPK